MNKILLLNLGNRRQAISIGQVAAQLREENPHTEIHQLTFDDHKIRAERIEFITKNHFIQRDRIQEIVNGPLFSNGYAIDTFYENLKDVLRTDWDTVINFSNDNLSSILASIIPSENIIGTHINDKGNVRHSDDWNLILNNVNSLSMRSYIANDLVFSHMLQSPWQKFDNSIKISNEFSLLASQNFSRIRDMKKEARIVGINLSQGYDGTFIDESTLDQLVGTFYESTDFIPVLLIEQGISEHKNIVSKLNKKYHNNLISINIDLIAFSAVVVNLDLMISPACDQLEVANQLNIECMELRNSPPFRVDPIITTEGSRAIYFEDNTYLTDTIILNTNEFFEADLPLSSMQDENRVYACVKDNYGYFYTQLHGKIDLVEELNYHLGRSVFFNLLGYPENSELLNNIMQMVHPEDIQEYVNITRSELTGVVKILLATLRSLKGIRNSEQNFNSFLEYYEQLLAYGDHKGIVGPLIKFAEARIEAIESVSAEENLIEIEKILFDLKSNLQKITHMCSHLIGDVAITSEKESEA